MGKIVKAVTRIVSDKFVIEPGETLDVTLVTRKDLENLHDVGAIVIEEVPDAPKPEPKPEVKEVPKLEVPEAPKPEVKEAPKPEVKYTQTSPTPTPKTPETLTRQPSVPTKTTVTKTTSPPVGRMTATSIQQGGKSDGKSNVK